MPRPSSLHVQTDNLPTSSLSEREVSDIAKERNAQDPFLSRRKDEFEKDNPRTGDFNPLDSEGLGKGKGKGTQWEKPADQHIHTQIKGGDHPHAWSDIVKEGLSHSSSSHEGEKEKGSEDIIQEEISREMGPAARPSASSAAPSAMDKMSDSLSGIKDAVVSSLSSLSSSIPSISSISSSSLSDSLYSIKDKVLPSSASAVKEDEMDMGQRTKEGIREMKEVFKEAVNSAQKRGTTKRRGKKEKKDVKESPASAAAPSSSSSVMGSVKSTINASVVPALSSIAERVPSLPSVDSIKSSLPTSSSLSSSISSLSSSLPSSVSSSVDKVLDSVRGMGLADLTDMTGYVKQFIEEIEGGKEGEKAGEGEHAEEGEEEHYTIRSEEKSPSSSLKQKAAGAARKLKRQSSASLSSSSSSSSSDESIGLHGTPEYHEDYDPLKEGREYDSAALKKGVKHESAYEEVGKLDSGDMKQGKKGQKNKGKGSPRLRPSSPSSSSDGSLIHKIASEPLVVESTQSLSFFTSFFSSYAHSLKTFALALRSLPDRKARLLHASVCFLHLIVPLFFIEKGPAWTVLSNFFYFAVASHLLWYRAGGKFNSLFLAHFTFIPLVLSLFPYAFYFNSFRQSINSLSSIFNSNPLLFTLSFPLIPIHLRRMMFVNWMQLLVVFDSVLIAQAIMRIMGIRDKIRGSAAMRELKGRGREMVDKARSKISQAKTQVEQTA